MHALHISNYFFPLLVFNSSFHIYLFVHLQILLLLRCLSRHFDFDFDILEIFLPRENRNKVSLVNVDV